MSAQADHSPSKLLELPSTWLAHLVQHVALGARGLSSAARLSQTCKSFYALSESSAVTYRNLHLDKALYRLDDPFFLWLAQRQGRVAGLTAELLLYTVVDLEPEPGQGLQVLFGIPGLHLTLRFYGMVSTPDDPFMTKVLRPHGHLIDHLDLVVRINRDGLKLQDFCKAAAPCRSLDLAVGSSGEEPLSMGALNPVAGSLIRLHLKSINFSVRCEWDNVSSLSLLTQLTLLSVGNSDFGAEEPWIHLAQLTNLKQLSLKVAASGDPSPLSALIGLSYLKLRSSERGLLDPWTFSSLQPLSTLQQLEELVLSDKACSATSLNGLAELSKLKAVKLEAPEMKTLAGVSAGLTSLAIDDAPGLHSLAGIEHLQGLQDLSMRESGVTSLQPLAALGSLEKAVDWWHIY